MAERTNALTTYLYRLPVGSSRPQGQASSGSQGALSVELEFDPGQPQFALLKPSAG